MTHSMWKKKNEKEKFEPPAKEVVDDYEEEEISIIVYTI